MELFALTALNGLSYGLLLFLLSAGLTLIFSMMGVLNFAHAGFYMLGAYMAYSLSGSLGFWPALLLAPVLVGFLGAVFERTVLRRVHRHGQVAELLVTFGLGLVMVELVQLIWGRVAVDYRIPDELQGQLTLAGLPLPRYRAFMMGVSLVVLATLGWGLKRTRAGLVIQAALTHPETVQTLGHDVPRLLMAVFGGGAALAALAGALGGNVFVTEPGMAATVGSVIFVVVVVGGLGSLAGAFLASLLIGLLQTWAVGQSGWLSQVAPMLPFALLVLMLVWRQRGLLGERDA
ncbi:MAG: hypothetical protein RL459_117 [Pseudomonadota bacterium]|jgi:branched-chain amino acid transport system permease protein